MVPRAISPRNFPINENKLGGSIFFWKKNLRIHSRVKKYTCTNQVFVDFHYYSDLEWFLEEYKKFTFLFEVKILRRWYVFD